MTKFFNASEFARNLTGLVAAFVLGTTLIAAAAGPACCRQQRHNGSGDGRRTIEYRRRCLTRS